MSGPTGAPPGGPPWPPPSPYGAQPGPPPRGGMSNKAKFWIGVALTLPALVVVGFVQAVPSALISAVGGSSEGAYQVGGIATLVADVLLFGLFVAGIIWERTRYLALGLLAGAAVLFVLAAGACVVLLVAISSSYG